MVYQCDEHKIQEGQGIGNATRKDSKKTAGSVHGQVLK